MQHVVNKAHTRCVAANLISGQLVHAGNHRHGTAGHNLRRGWTPKAADVRVFGNPIPIEGGIWYNYCNWSPTGVLNLSSYTLIRSSCQHKSAHRPWEVRRHRGLRVKGLNCEFQWEGICSRRPACSGDPQLRWSYEGGHPGLNRPSEYLVQRVGAFLILLHCAY